jgi:hypothetical protein
LRKGIRADVYIYIYIYGSRQIYWVGGRKGGRGKREVDLIFLKAHKNENSWFIAPVKT